MSSRVSDSRLDQDRIDHGRRDRRMAQNVLLHAGGVDDIPIQIEQRFPVGEIERRRRVDLPPDEHVLRRQRNLLVAFAHVCPHVREDLLARQIDLRIQIRHAELAAPAASRRHLDDAERCALVGKENGVTRNRVADVDLSRQPRPESPCRRSQTSLRIRCAPRRRNRLRVPRRRRSG